MPRPNRPVAPAMAGRFKLVCFGAGERSPIVERSPRKELVRLNSSSAGVGAAKRPPVGASCKDKLRCRLFPGAGVLGI